MFKRAHSSKSSNLISNSARKKLIHQAQEEFFTQSQDDELINQLIPSTISISKAYTHLDHQLAIYHDQLNQPIWIKLDKGNGRLIPTVYTLLKYPNLLPILRTNRTVLEKLTQGADFMIPGLIPADLDLIQELKKDTLVAIAPSDAVDLIWAVGFLADDGAKLARSRTGKAVITVHTQADYLWNSGTKEIPSRVEISGPIPPSNEANGQERTGTNGETSGGLNGDRTLKLDQLCLDDYEEHGSKTAQDDHLQPSLSPKLPPAEVDEILKQALLTSLWHQKVESSVPMTGSQFYSSFILPLRPAECPKSVGVKDSSAKNLAKWLKNMHKLQLITVKEDQKKRSEIVVVGVNTAHPALESFRKYRTIHDQEKADIRNNGQDVGDHTTNSSAIDPESCLFQLPETKIGSVYKAAKNEGGWFWLIRIDLDPEGLYTYQELKDHVIKYVNERIVPQIVPKNGGGGGASHHQKKKKAPGVDLTMVEPDDYLRAAMGSFPPPEIRPFTRLQIIELVVENSFGHWWRLERNQQVIIEKKGDIPKIVLGMKKKSSKNSTLIRGLEFFAIDPLRFAKEIKTICAGSTTTRPITVDPNGYNKILKELTHGTKVVHHPSLPPTLIEVECQGDQRQFLAKYLCSNTPISRLSIDII